MDINTFKISWLYAIYSLPNMIMSPVTGYIIEVIGCNNSAAVYTGLTFLGQIIIYFGFYSNSYYMILFGRGVYGVGGEGLTILQLTINELWFYGSFLSMSVAWCDVVAVFAILAGNFLNPELLAITRNLSWSFFVMGLMCFISAIAGCAYYYYHNKFIHTIKLRDNDISDDEEEEAQDISEFNSPSLKKNMNDDAPVNSSRKERDTTAEDYFNENKLGFGFRSIRYFSTTYWLLTVCFLFLANCYY